MRSRSKYKTKDVNKKISNARTRKMKGIEDFGRR